MILKIAAGDVRRRARVAFFDFDGTVSLLRSGWMKIMLGMMLPDLMALHTGETEEDLRAICEDFIWRLTGKDTVFQTLAFADAMRERGAPAVDAAAYKARFLTALCEVSEARMNEIRTGASPPDKYLVPGTRPMLETLRDRGVTLYLASGTDDRELQNEAKLLDIDRYFDGGVHGSQPDPSFSKEGLISGVLERGHASGEQLIGFGDGNVEVRLIAEAGGLSVGLATDEAACSAIDEWKCRRLKEAGAQVIVPNYLDRDALLAERLNSRRDAVQIR